MTTKTILVLNLFCGNLPAGKAEDYAKEQIQKFVKSTKLPEDVAVVSRMTKDVPNKLIDIIRLDGVNFDESCLDEYIQENTEKTHLVNVRLTQSEKEAIQANAKSEGYKNISEYIRQKCTRNSDE